jgi:general secretion pathway protein I
MCVVIPASGACPLSRLRARVAGALPALAARMKRDGRVRAGVRTRPPVVECHDAPILAPPFFGVRITPPPRAQRARLSSGWHRGRQTKSDRTASHLLSRSESRDQRGAAGFTLLEVMIAIAVLGVAMLALLSLHDSNLQSVMRGQELSTASSLAQSLMTNAEMERIPMVGSTQGDFQRLFPGAYRNFKWQRTVEMSAMFPDIRKVQVTVFYGPRFRHNFSIVEFLHDPTPQIPNGGQVAPGSLGQSPAVGQTTH